MRNFFSWLVKRALNWFVASTFFVVGVIGIAYAAISWPSSVPLGETAGGNFSAVLNRILASGNYATDTTGKVKLAADSDKLASIDASGWQRRVSATCPAGSAIWSIGSDGSVSCQSFPVGGSCGSANWSKALSAPSSNLCSSGTATSVSWSGPWTWTCKWSNWGGDASCKAELNVMRLGFCGVAPTNVYSNPDCTLGQRISDCPSNPGAGLYCVDMENYNGSMPGHCSSFTGLGPNRFRCND